MSKARTANSIEAEKIAVEVTAEQAEHLERTFQWIKALGSPIRLALLGALAARLARTLTIEQLAEAISLPAALTEEGDWLAGPVRILPGQIDRDVQILADAGLVRIVEWQSPAPGREPRPARVAFNLDYLRAVPQVTGVLHRVLSQVHPEAAAPTADERAQVLGRLMQNGRLLSWPVQFKRQTWVIEEVAKAFESHRTYTEREVDAILKDIYEFDHCTLRRSLIDLKFMQRENGVYWKTAAPPAPTGV
jgi:hypothetical protein